jgi:hypothetical protein
MKAAKQGIAVAGDGTRATSRADGGAGQSEPDLGPPDRDSFVGVFCVGIGWSLFGFHGFTDFEICSILFLFLI